ncbi:MAG: hypothetical protein QOG28_4721 [Trebonia sp.]|nr:hypothetical protein [Trebonia sp.]
MNRRAALACAAAAALAATAAGCSSSSSAGSPPPTAQLERTSHGLSVVLTPLGAQRIALRTGQATVVKGSTGAPGGAVAVPYNALVYEPAGEAAVYVATGTLTYTRYLVPVTVIAGQTVYLKPGSLPTGATVVTQGAEELLGVQNGVGEET